MFRHRGPERLHGRVAPVFVTDLVRLTRAKAKRVVWRPIFLCLGAA